jgi:carbon monoxide dehydrogenase subunit G
MIVARGDVYIQRPIDEVFDFVADSRNEPAWLPGASGVEKTTEGPIGHGTRFEGQYARAGTVFLELIEFERPHRVTFRAKSRIVKFDDAVILETEGTGTRLRATMEARAGGLLRVIEPLMGRTMRRQFEENWNLLKHALETGSDRNTT